MPLAHDPRYILRLSELPKVVEADAVLLPVFMTIKDTARLFAVTERTIREWGEKYGLPLIRFGPGDKAHTYVEVAAFNDWIRAHSTPRQ